MVLPRLTSDFLEVCLAAASGSLDTVPPPTWSASAACGVVVASSGYPGAFERGFEITGLDRLPDDFLVFQAGTRREPDGRIVTSGGRVLTVVALAETVAAARERIYAHIGDVRFTGARWRTDIAAREA